MNNMVNVTFQSKGGIIHTKPFPFGEYASIRQYANILNATVLKVLFTE